MANILLVNPGSTVVKYSDNNGAVWNTAYSGASLVGSVQPKIKIKSNGTLALLVGDSGFATTLNGVSWSNNTAKSWSPRGIEWNGSTYFVLDNTPVTGYTSPDGISWTTRSLTWDFASGSALACNVIKNGSTFVALASGRDATSNYGSFQTSISTDGITWTKGTIKTLQTNDIYGSCNDIVFDGTNYWVIAVDWDGAAGYYPLLYSSTDGLVWTKSTVSPWNAANSTFSPISISSDGSNRLLVTGATATGASTTLYYFSSNSGTSWSSGSLPRSAAWAFNGYINSRFIVTATNSSYLQYSTNGTSWTEVLMSQSGYRGLSEALQGIPKTMSGSAISTATATALRSFTKNVSALAISIGNAFKQTTNIFNIKVSALSSAIVSNVVSKISSLVAAATSMSNAFKSVFAEIPILWQLCYAATQWIGVKRDSTVSTNSTNGTSWNKRTLPIAKPWTGLAQNGSIAIAVNSLDSTIVKSTDGINWTQGNLPTNRAWSGVASGGSILVAIARNSDKCASSTNNGSTWTEYSMPEADWTAIAWNGTVFVTVSTSNIAATSPDGVTWTQRTMPDSIEYMSVAWALGQFTAIARGPTNLAAKSTDGITWSRVTLPTVANWTQVAASISDPTF